METPPSTTSQLGVRPAGESALASEPAAKRAKEEEAEVKQPEVAATTAQTKEAKEQQQAEQVKAKEAHVPTPSGAQASRADTKRMLEKHQEYTQAQMILSKLPTLFPGYSQQEANGFLIWLAQLPVAMHRPRPTASEHGWKAAGEIMTVQSDEKVPSIFKKLINNNISCVPVLDVHRRYIGIIDNLALVIHTLRCFGVLGDTETSKDPSVIACESIETETSGSMDVDMAQAAAPSGADAEMKIEQLATGSDKVPTMLGLEANVKPTEPVHVKGGRTSFMSRPIWKSTNKSIDKAGFADWWDRNDFKDLNASAVLAESISALSTPTSYGMAIGENEIPNLAIDVMAAPLVQGSSTLFAIELMGRMGLHRCPILNSERFVTGLITSSMLISLISQYKEQVPSFLSMPVANMMPFLLPHRLVKVDEDAITAEAMFVMVKERVNSAAIVNAAGVLVDVLSSRDLRGIGRTGAEFERLWMITREFKEATRQLFPEKTPTRVRFVVSTDRMVDVLSNFSDGNLHQIFVCEKSADGLPRPIGAITQRDVLRVLLVFLGLTLQGEVRVATA